MFEPQSEQPDPGQKIKKQVDLRDRLGRSYTKVEMRKGYLDYLDAEKAKVNQKAEELKQSHQESGFADEISDEEFQRIAEVHTMWGKRLKPEYLAEIPGTKDYYEAHPTEKATPFTEKHMERLAQIAQQKEDREARLGKTQVPEFDQTDWREVAEAINRIVPGKFDEEELFGAVKYDRELRADLVGIAERLNSQQDTNFGDDLKVAIMVNRAKAAQ
jgi:hypothetical protein